MIPRVSAFFFQWSYSQLSCNLGAIFCRLLELGITCCSGLWRASIHTLAVFHVEIVITYGGSILASQGHLSRLGVEFLAATTLVFHLVCFKRVSVFREVKRMHLVKNTQKTPSVIFVLGGFGLVLVCFFNILFSSFSRTLKNVIFITFVFNSETVFAFIIFYSIQWKHINTFVAILWSQNCAGWNRPFRSLSLSINPALYSAPLNHVSKCHTCVSFKYLQGWWLQWLPWAACSSAGQPFQWRNIS